MSQIVFAYGSNMCLGRFLKYEVQPEASGVPGNLAGYRLTFTKTSTDGSGKANVEASAGDEVWGVLYSVRDTELTRLDNGERGYCRMRMPVQTTSGSVDAWVYVATPSMGVTLRPYSWYKRFLVKGAQCHGLPREYVERLEAIPAQDDADVNRDSRKRRWCALE